MKKQLKGFIAPVITPDQFIFGAGNVPLAVIQPDGDWGPLLPIEEKQNIRDIETYNCTAFGTTNAIELLMYKLTGQRLNYSDRWVGIVAGTRAPGNDPHKVAEAIRKYGLIPEEMLPFSEDIKTADDYYSFKGADKEACYRAGREWLEKYDFKHEWTFTPGQPIQEQLNNMQIALQGSPQGVAVYGWASNEQDVYYSLGAPNHWTMVYNIEQFMEVFDSYTPFRKKIDQSILYCKRYSITLKKKDELTPAQASGLWAQIRKLLEMVGILQKQIEALPKPTPTPYEEVKEALKPKYDWSTPTKARHSVRVICDEEGMTVKDKNDLCATVGAESGWKPKAIGKPNKDGSRDYGIAQINDKYWIGPGKKFESIDYVLDNPEVCIRWMCQEWKLHKNWWYGYKNGSYKKFL